MYIRLASLVQQGAHLDDSPTNIYFCCPLLASPVDRTDLSERVQSELDADETVLWRAGPGVRPAFLEAVTSWSGLLFAHTALTTGSVIGVFAGFTTGSVPIFVAVTLLVVAGFYSWYGFKLRYKFRNEEFVVTDRRVIAVRLTTPGIRDSPEGVKTDVRDPLVRVEIASREAIQTVMTTQGLGHPILGTGYARLVVVDPEPRAVSFGPLEDLSEEVEQLRKVLDENLPSEYTGSTEHAHDVLPTAQSYIGVDETVLWKSDARVTPQALAAAVFGMLFGMLGAYLTALLTGSTPATVIASAGVFATVVLLYLVTAVFQTRNEQFVVTDQQAVQVYTSFASRVTRAVPLTDVETVGIKQGIFGNLLGVGNITFELQRENSVQDPTTVPGFGALERFLNSLFARPNMLDRVTFTGIDDLYSELEQLRQILSEERSAEPDRRVGAVSSTDVSRATTGEQSEVAGSRRVDSHLNATEEIVWRASKSGPPDVTVALKFSGILVFLLPVIWIPPLVLFLLFPMVFLTLSLSGLVLLFVYLAGSYAYQARTAEYILTDKNILTLDTDGLVLETTLTPRRPVYNVTVEQGALNKLFGIGDITLEMDQSAVGLQRVTFESVKDPQAETEQLREVLSVGLTDETAEETEQSAASAQPEQTSTQ
jgi:membrane protein YdbS with pleckstrin-like domain